VSATSGNRDDVVELWCSVVARATKAPRRSLAADLARPVVACKYIKWVDSFTPDRTNSLSSDSVTDTPRALICFIAALV
jgi:hypothetical protein